MARVLMEEDISRLGIDSEVICKLNKKDICKIGELWHLKRRDLKELGFSDQEIKHIVIKLQLNSFDLNNKVYNKN